MLNPAVFTLHEEDVADEVPIEVDSGLQISDDVKGMEKLLSGHDNAVDDMSPVSVDIVLTELTVDVLQLIKF